MNHSVGSSPENRGNSKLDNFEENNGCPPSKFSLDSSLMKRERPLGDLVIGSERLAPTVGLLTDAF